MDHAATATERIRRTMELSRDPRVARTRAAIVGAVHTLTAEGASSVDVAAIIRIAHISRATFYAHFASLDRLALYIFEQEIGSVTADIAAEDPAVESDDHMRRFLVRLVDHYVDNHTLYAAALALPMTREVTSRAVDWIAQALVEWMRDHPAPPHLIPEVIAVHAGSAMVGMLDAWTQHDFDITAEQAVEHLLELLPPWLARDDAE